MGRPTGLRRTALDRMPRVKTRWGLRQQRHILDIIDRGAIDSLACRTVPALLRRLVGPVLWSLKLELNNACQLHCPMCYVPKGDTLLPFAMIRRLLDSIAEGGTRLELLGGEPLLRDDLSTIIAYAKSVARVPRVVLYTNGIDATPQRSAELAEAGLDTAIVTLVSDTPEEHDRFVGLDGAWRRTVRGIAHLQQAGVRVYTFTAVHASNVGRVRKIHTLVKRELAAHALFYPYIPQRTSDPLALDPDRWAAAKHYILYDASPAHARFFRNFCVLAGTACSGGRFVYTVKVDGTVTPCPFISDLCLGTLAERSIWDIISDRFQNEAFLAFESLPDTCRGCAYAAICNGGCKAGNRLLFGRYDHADARCLGPWAGPADDEAFYDRLPCFF
jgi:radical SAM protein with 4Fe4S-binding SPASM domain